MSPALPCFSFALFHFITRTISIYPRLVDIHVHIFMLLEGIIIINKLLHVLLRYVESWFFPL